MSELYFDLIVVFLAALFGVVCTIFLTFKSLKTSRRTTKQKVFYHPTKATSNPLPSDPRYYNIGSNIFHKNRECCKFSLLETWDAMTEAEALNKGMTICPMCESPIVFVYSRGRVYHKTKFCSDSQSIPMQIKESEAISKGLHRCGKCWQARPNRLFND